MNCRLCKNPTDKSHTASLLNKYTVQYYRCSKCELIQTEDPYWLAEAYKKSINTTDTGYMKRNKIVSQITAVILYFFLGSKGKFLDFGGGYGVFTRIMRDIGFDFYWHDCFTENLFARGFEWHEKQKYALVTSFETFEHFVNPGQEIVNILNYSTNIFFTTSLYKDSVPDDKWSYWGKEHGQHIAFYSRKTLEFIAAKHSLNLWTNGHDLHLFSQKKMSPSALFISTRLARIGLGLLVSLLLRSKTISDYESLRKHT